MRSPRRNLIEPPLDLTRRRAIRNTGPSELSGRVLPTGSVRLLPKGRIEALPGFEQGAWWVQDVAASLPAHLMGDVAGKRVADLCAAPGGKTAQLALAGASVVAVDSSKTRLRTLVAQISRGSVLPPPRSPPTPRPGRRRSASTRCCSTRRARPPAPSAGIPTFPISSRQRTSRRWPPCRPGFSTMPPPCSSQAARSSIPPARSSSRRARPRLPRCLPETGRSGRSDPAG